MTADEIRKRLKLEPAEVFRRRQLKTTGGLLFKDLPPPNEHKTGRTTELLIPALAQLSDGATVYLEAADKTDHSTREFARYAQHLAHKCGLDWKRVIAGPPPPAGNTTCELRVWITDHLRD